MKKLLLTIMFLFAMVSAAQAEWYITFDKTRISKSLDAAVAEALVQGVSTNNIVAYWTLNLKGPAAPVFVSLYCSGVDAVEITRLADLFFIPLSQAIEAYKTSTLRCR